MPAIKAATFVIPLFGALAGGKIGVGPKVIAAWHVAHLDAFACHVIGDPGGYFVRAIVG